MRKLLDVNVWMALSLPAHPQHRAARQWYRRSPLAESDLLFCRQTEMSFLRLTTQERTMEKCGAKALTNDEAIVFMAELGRDPAVAKADEPVATRRLWLKLARGSRSSPNVWMDAYLAALAISLDVELVTFDLGFKAYTTHGLRLVLLQT